MFRLIVEVNPLARTGHEIFFAPDSVRHLPMVVDGTRVPVRRYPASVVRRARASLLKPRADRLILFVESQPFVV